ncbi:hypothetical protein ANG5_0861 [Streptococcus constellatus subsp. pharyngis SK1060 = CCUG 46377]|uniref:Uncharacterized protein n=1 Tax=Streptococcus constellatus subsp. pharyngis SK1060 = CCUG 46377 TaxID=1035184 RepID=U2ZPA4_STRCV|nr:hypothetical protein ANG5_0861 [Streptococcus constellatus subsp. pharyngis SK1060 = CCUG 46377]
MKKNILILNNITTETIVNEDNCSVDDGKAGIVASLPFFVIAKNFDTIADY